MSSAADLVLATQKDESYLGIARVCLQSLNFENTLVAHKHRSELFENVRRLENVFEKTGCLRLQDENVIDAVVDEEDLSAALATIHITKHDFRKLRAAKEAPHLPLKIANCLSGLHRIRAADRVLDENDKWWVVRLFSRETPQAVLNHVIESYGNEQRPSDGEIFRKIRFYHRNQDESNETKWWARLDKSKPKDLRQLLKNGRLASAFDCLLDMPGLWNKIQLGALHRLLALKCDEEMISYLAYVRETWATMITCSEQTLPFSVVDDVTVESLELLAPHHSQVDKELVIELMKRRVLFPAVEEQQLRQQLIKNICASPGVIPSLWTFFETLKFVEPICDALKQLIGFKLKRTLRSTLMAHYIMPVKPVVQVAECQDVIMDASQSKDQAALLAYIELWAFCARHFDGLTACTPRKETGETKPLVKGPNPVVWQLLADFAISRGFQVRNAKDLIKEDPYSPLAEDYLRKANPITSSFSSQQIRDVVLASQTEIGPMVAHDILECGHLDKERRSGRPFMRDHDTDKKILFLPLIYGGEDPKHANLHLVRRDLFRRLFGPINFQYTSGNAVSATPSNEPEPMDIDTISQRDETENVDLRTRYEELERNHETIVTEHRNLQSLHDQSEEKRYRLQDQNIAAAVKIENLQKSLEEVKMQAISLQQQLTEIKAQKDHLQDKITSINQNQNSQLIGASPNTNEIEIDPRYIKLREQLDGFRSINTIWTEKHRATKQSLELQNDQAMARCNETITRLEEILEGRDKTIAGLRNALLERDFRIVELENSHPISGPDRLRLTDPVTASLESIETHTMWQDLSEEVDEIFFATSIDENGILKGVSFPIERDEETGLAAVQHILETEKRYLGEDLRAANIQGKYLSSITPMYIHAACHVNHTIFIGAARVLSVYVSTKANMIVLGSYQITQRSTPIIENKKRRLRDGCDNDVDDLSQSLEVTIARITQTERLRIE